MPLSDKALRVWCAENVAYSLATGFEYEAGLGCQVRVLVAKGPGGDCAGRLGGFECWAGGGGEDCVEGGVVAWEGGGADFDGLVGGGGGSHFVLE